MNILNGYQKEEENKMNEEKVIKLLEFQAQFTKREWNELLTQINVQYNKKADELQLTDQDLTDIKNRLTSR